jgi:hypothetical protein
MSAVRRKGPGRPPLPASERKGKIFSMRLSREERAQVEAAAKARGLTAAAWGASGVAGGQRRQSGWQRSVLGRPPSSRARWRSPV